MFVSIKNICFLRGWNRDRSARLELATSCVTGRRSNRLNYGPGVKILDWWAVRDLNTRPSGCKPDALTAELTDRPFRFYRSQTKNPNAI
jgi:hypothetical protein